jgi:hypothetical protein
MSHVAFHPVSGQLMMKFSLHDLTMQEQGERPED